MSYHITVEQFEGPLDLLVQLVEANRLEVTAISAAAVTRQFMDAVEHLPNHQLAELSRYLELAARLLYIKSLALLPQATIDENEAAELSRLGNELTAYKRNQNRMRRLARQLSSTGQQFGRPSIPNPQREIKLPTSQALESTLRAMLDTKPAWEETRTEPKLSLEHMIERVRTTLTATQSPLSNLIEDHYQTGEVALLLVAVLELVRQNQAAIRQATPFGPIMVSEHA